MTGENKPNDETKINESGANDSGLNNSGLNDAGADEMVDGMVGDIVDEIKDIDSFEALGLHKLLVERLERAKILKPTQIQKELFQPIQDGTCVLGLAKTGTGKTLSYLAPLVQKYSLSELDQQKSDIENAEGPLVFVLVPTRELASQVQSTFVVLTEAEQQAVVVVGGESEDKQIDAMGQAKFVIATPGRLLDLMKRKKISTRNVDVVVMDEADRLLDMGFIDDIRSILKFLNKPQLVCVSATLHLGVEEVAYEMGLEPQRFGEEEAEMTVKGLDHRVAHIGDREKFHALANFIYERKDKRGIVFSNYRDRAHEVASRLRGLGCKADALSAQLSQSLRKRITDAYRTGDTKVLVASDLAARGLDFLDIDYVVNFDLPEDPATYVHRVGRTARAGREGRALSLLGFEDVFRIEKLERFLGDKIEVEQFDADKLSGDLPRFGPREERSEEEEYRPRHSSGSRPHQKGGRSGGGPRHDSKKPYRKEGRQGSDSKDTRSGGAGKGHSSQNSPSSSSRSTSQSGSRSESRPRPSHHSKNRQGPNSARQGAASSGARTASSKPESQGIFSKLWKKVSKVFGIVEASEVKTAVDPKGASTSSGQGSRSRSNNRNRNRNRPGQRGRHPNSKHAGSNQSDSGQGGKGNRNYRHSKNPNSKSGSQSKGPKPSGQ